MLPKHNYKVFRQPFKRKNINNRSSGLQFHQSILSILYHHHCYLYLFHQLRFKVTLVPTTTYIILLNLYAPINSTSNPKDWSSGSIRVTFFPCIPDTKLTYQSTPTKHLKQFQRNHHPN
ncbi:hypothetical protein ACTFIU_009165 [Dictyostelium citrinum]